MVANVFSEMMIPQQGQMQLKARKSRLQFEVLESRMMMSATLFVTGPGVPADATHFSTLQAALMAFTTR